MCLKRKDFVGYMGKLTASVDAPWTTVHVGDTTNMAQEGLPFYARMSSVSLPGRCGKHGSKWVIQVLTHPWGWEGVGARMFTCTGQTGVFERNCNKVHDPDGFFWVHVGG